MKSAGWRWQRSRLGFRAKGQRKLSTYSRAELTMKANALIAPWLIEQARPRSLNEILNIRTKRKALCCKGRVVRNS